MHSPARSLVLSLFMPLVAFVACHPDASPTTPAATGGTATAPPAASKPAPTPEAQAEAGESTSACGVDGTAREQATSCEFIVDKRSGECCFATQEAACREAGCAVASCSLQKSNPPKAICTGPAAPSSATATCESAGGTCTAKTATVACKSTPAASCGGDQICCVM